MIWYVALDEHDAPHVQVGRLYPVEDEDSVISRVPRAVNLVAVDPDAYVDTNYFFNCGSFSNCILDHDYLVGNA